MSGEETARTNAKRKENTETARPRQNTKVTHKTDMKAATIAFCSEMFLTR